MATSEPLFDHSLISAEAAGAFPESYVVRPLDRGDYAKGFLDCLRVLTHVGDVSEAAFLERFDWMRSQGKDIHFYLVIERSGRIVGTGTVVIERKFIHDLGTIGHIEEISIAKDQQAKGLGLRLLDALNSIAKNVGCYKTTLGCGAATEPFYVKCGFEKRATVMSRYFEDDRPPYNRG